VAAAVSLLLGGVLLTGCGGPDEAPDIGPWPDVTPATTLPPGTPITDWLTVPQGTMLLGSAFPRRDGGVQALMLVTGDALDAVADLSEQAYNAGFRWLSSGGFSGDHGACEIVSGDWAAATETYPVDARPPDEPHWLYCGGYGVRPVAEGHQWSLSFRLILGSEPEPYLSHLYLSLDWLPVADEAEELELPTTPLEVPDAPAPVDPPPYPTSMPEPGDDIGEPFTPTGEDYPLLEGSRLTAPPFPSQCVTGGFYAVLELEEVGVNRYDAAYRDVFGGLPENAATPGEEFTRGETRAVYRQYHLVGGGDLTIHAVEYPGRPAYLMVSRCND